MIRLPINPLTPPIRITSPAQPSKPTTQNPASPSQGGSGGTYKPNGGKSGVPSLEALFQQMLKRYLPETVEFTPLDEKTLSETISKWLRPAYDQAIQARREQTERVNAELDADAWSRGMGQSSYLSDVKERQYRGEERDVDALEGSYASELAGHLYDAMKEQQQMKIDVDKFNAEQMNHAHEQAMNAAQALYHAMLSRAGSGGGRSSSSAANAQGTSGSSMLQSLVDGMGNASKTDYRTIANTVARMSPQERSRLYDRSDPKYIGLRSEILWSLNGDEYAKLMRAFPGA